MKVEHAQLAVQSGKHRNCIRELAIMPSEITIRVAIELSHSSWIVAVRLPEVEKKSRLHRLEYSISVVENRDREVALYPPSPVAGRIAQIACAGAKADPGPLLKNGATMPSNGDHPSPDISF